MRDALARMLELDGEGRRFVAATVVRTQGSTPQVVGARLLVDDRGRIPGTLGGGCVEGDAIAEAQRVLTTAVRRSGRTSSPSRWRGTRGSSAAARCGFTSSPGRDTERPAGPSGCAPTSTSRTAEPAALGTRLRVDGRNVTAEGHCLIERVDDVGGLSERAQRLLAEAFERGAARLVPLDGGHELLVEPIVARPRLIIAGGGHVALALAQMARLLDYDDHGHRRPGRVRRCRAVPRRRGDPGRHRRGRDPSRSRLELVHRGGDARAQARCAVPPRRGRDAAPATSGCSAASGRPCSSTRCFARRA